jgi:16S rRNA (guanine527-N7)-methyltransferase
MTSQPQILLEGAKLLGLDLNVTQLALFELYRKELLLWNAKINLIAESTEHEIISRHFLDSLTAWKWISEKNARIIDIGTGAGFPGIPLKIAIPSLQLFLVESSRRKMSFLKHIIRLLKLSHTWTLHDRTENILKENIHRERFDIVVSRAAVKLPDLISWGSYFLVPGGFLIAYKGTKIQKELDNAKKTLDDLGFFKINHDDIDIPLLGPPRRIFVFQKPDIHKKTF